MRDDFAGLLDRRTRRLDPLDTLRRTKDPMWAEWAMRTMYKHGFRDVIGIARDCGWLVVKNTALATYLVTGDES